MRSAPAPATRNADREDTTRRAASPLPTSCYRDAAVVVVLLAVAAGAGLFLRPYSAETDFARNGYRGADLVTLSLVVPLLAWATLAARRGSTRGLLLWLGAMSYATYQYGYAFAYSWNRLFLVYLVLLSLSGFTVARALVALDPQVVAGRFGTATPTAGITRYLWSIGIALGVMELGQLIPTLFTGDVPQIVTDTAHPTSPVFILDLGLVVPLTVLSAHWIGQRRAWGYVAAPIMLVKGAGVGLGLLAANLMAALGDGKTDGPLVLLWAAIAGGSAFALWRFLRHADALDLAAPSSSSSRRHTPLGGDPHV